MVAVQPDQGDVALVEEGQADAPVTEPVTEETGLIEAHLGDPLTEPPVELVFDERGEGAIAARKLEHQVARASGTAAHVPQAVERGDGAA